jgi:hypothetical protein
MAQQDPDVARALNLLEEQKARREAEREKRELQALEAEADTDFKRAMERLQYDSLQTDVNRKDAEARLAKAQADMAEAEARKAEAEARKAEADAKRAAAEARKAEAEAKVAEGVTERGGPRS